MFLFSPFLASPFFTLSFFVSLSLSLLLFIFSFLPVSHVSFWFLFFVFVLFASCFKMLFFILFFCLLSSFVLNQNIGFVFDLHLVFLLLFFVLLSRHFSDFWLPIKKNIFPKNGYCKKPKMKNAEKKQIFFTRAVVTGNKLGPVLTQLFGHLFFCKRSSSFYRENEIFNNKQMDQLLTQKGQTLDQSCIYIYIFILY